VPELEPEYEAIAELREFVEQIANGLLQSEFIRGRCFRRTLFTANPRNANDSRARIEKGLSSLDAQVFKAAELALPHNPQQASLSLCVVSCGSTR
jgi:hypothetical protein